MEANCSVIADASQNIGVAWKTTNLSIQAPQFSKNLVFGDVNLTLDEGETPYSIFNKCFEFEKLMDLFCKLVLKK